LQRPSAILLKNRHDHYLRPGPPSLISSSTTKKEKHHGTTEENDS
jgi:hypothetical protein